MARGYRNTRTVQDPIAAVDAVVESDDAIEERIRERFDVLQDLTQGAISGEVRAVIVSGSPGVGKSHSVIQALEANDPNENTWTVIKGFAKSTGLLKTLYQYRHKGSVIVFDDIDNIFSEDVSLNMFKAVADSSVRRRVSWLSEYKMVDEDTAEIIPRHFDFEGSIIFLTNLDFQALIDKKHKYAPHLEALMSRSLYLDLTLKTRKDCLVRIGQVVEEGLLSNLDIEAQADVLSFVEIYAESLRELSLRSVIKLAGLRASNPSWERVARICLCK